MPWPGTRCAGNPSIRSPPSRTAPDQTGTSPIATFSMVVLPAPLRPITQVTSPAAAVRLKPLQHPDRAIAGRHRVKLQHHPPR